MPEGKFLFTSEAVSMGHPDKLADQISDGILDALLANDPLSRVACETLVTTGIAIVAGEISTKATIDYQEVIRQAIREVGIYRRPDGDMRRHLRDHAFDRPPKPGYRPGRQRRRRQGERYRGRRPGPDVRLCLQRYARTDAAADPALAPNSQSADRRAAKRRSRLAAAR